MANTEKAKNLGSFSPNFRPKEHFDAAFGVVYPLRIFPVSFYSFLFLLACSRCNTLSSRHRDGKIQPGKREITVRELSGTRVGRV